MSSSSFSSSPPVRTRAVRTPYHKWRAHHITWMNDGHDQFGSWDIVTQHMNNEARKIGEPQSFNTPMVKAYHRFLRKKAAEKEAEDVTMKDESEEEVDTEEESGDEGDVEVEKFVKEAVVGLREESGKGKAKGVFEKKGAGERADIMKVKSVLQSVEPEGQRGRGNVEIFEYEEGMEWSEGMTWNGAFISREAFDAAQCLLKMSKSTM